MPPTLTAFEGMTGPDPFDPDPEDPEPEPPDPDPDDPDPEPLDPDPDDPDPEPLELEPEPPDPDPDDPDPEPLDPDPDEPDPDEPDPDPADAAPAFTIRAEQADRQKKERLRSAKRNCERQCFIDSPAESATAHAHRLRRKVGMRPLRSIPAHTTPVGAHASFFLPLRANATKWLWQPGACISPEIWLDRTIHRAVASQRRAVT